MKDFLRRVRKSRESLVRTDGLGWRGSVEVRKGLTVRTFVCGISSRRPLLSGFVCFSRNRCVFCATACWPPFYLGGRSISLTRDSRRHQVSWQLERRVLSLLRVAESGQFYCPFSRRNGRALQNQVDGRQDCCTSASCSEDQVGRCHARWLEAKSDFSTSTS